MHPPTSEAPYKNVGSCCQPLPLPTRLEEKTLCWWCLHASVAQCRGSKREPSWVLHLCWLAFRVLEGAMKAPGREETPIVLPSCEFCKSGDKPAGQVVPTCVPVTKLLGVTQPPSRWIWGLFHRRKLRPGTKSLVSIPCLERWRPKRGTHHPTYLNGHSIKPHDRPPCFPLRLTWLSLYSQKPFFVAKGGEFRGPWLPKKLLIGIS